MTDLSYTIALKVSAAPLISQSSNPCINPLGSVQRARFTMGITVTFVFHSYSSSSSSCRAGSTDIPDPLLPLFPIVHRLRQVFWTTSRILTKLLNVCSCWSSCIARPCVGVHKSTSLRQVFWTTSRILTKLLNVCSCWSSCIARPCVGVHKSTSHTSVFPWSLINRKSPQASTTLLSFLSNLNNAVV